MKGCVQWSPVYDCKEFCLHCVSDLGLLYQQASAYLIEPLELLPVKVLIKVIYAIYLHCYFKNSYSAFLSHPKQPKHFRSILQDKSRIWDCFRKGKNILQEKKYN